MDKRAKRKAATTDDDGKDGMAPRPQKVLKKDSSPTAPPKEKHKKPKPVGAKPNADAQLDSVLGSLF